MFATPWARLWAKLLDLSIWGWIVSFGFGLLLPEVASSPTFQGSSGNVAWLLVTLPIAMVIDAIVQATVGTTPGAACAGFRIETADHGKLPIRTALQRNVALYFRGLGLGIPIISIFTFWNAYRALQRGELCTWDRDLFTRPFQRGGNVYRTILTAVLVLVVRLGMLIGLAYAAPQQ